MSAEANGGGDGVKNRGGSSGDGVENGGGGGRRQIHLKVENMNVH